MPNLKFYSLFATSLIMMGGGITHIFLSHPKVQSDIPNVQSVIVAPGDGNVIAVSKENNKLTSPKDYKVIRPLLQTNQEKESQEFSPAKAKIMTLINAEKKLGLLSSASVYLYSFNDGKWLYVNPSESFNPGSMLKVPMLITYLKESETDPSILTKTVTFDNAETLPHQTYASESIQLGNTYTIEELLRYMIAFSDNNATKILNSNVDIKDFYKTFTDLKMAEPRITDMTYQISAKDISDFFIALYYSTYLNHSNSEYALKLLSECNFKDGLAKELPPTIKIAHKFGEWGDNRTGVHQMHETGVIYFNNKPYLLSVMTKGQNSRDLGCVVSKISKMVYDDFSATSTLK